MEKGRVRRRERGKEDLNIDVMKSETVVSRVEGMISHCTIVVLEMTVMRRQEEWQHLKSIRCTSSQVPYFDMRGVSGRIAGSCVQRQEVIPCDHNVHSGSARI